MSGATIIDVTFLDADSGKEFLRLKLPVRQLPESFAKQTTMNLGKDDWLVVEASPSNREEIVQAGALRLLVRKVQYVDPATLLFSLPTVADLIPEDVVEGAVPPDALRLHEDDWLQLELVPAAVVGKAQADLDAVKAVLAHERQGAGFKRLHIRQGLAAPFAAQDLQLATLRALFGPERALAWRSGTSPLQGCFAFPLPSGAWLYGQERDGRVLALGLTAPDAEATGRLEGLAVIDWLSGTLGFQAR